MSLDSYVSADTIQAFAARHGLSILALSGLEPLSSAVSPLKDWQNSGKAGSMGYMLKPETQLCTPQAILPAARSALIVSVFYSQRKVGPRRSGFGRVARYAWGKDYHAVLRERLTAFVKDLECEVGRSISYRVASDALPLLERAFAERSGMGFIGKNSMLIRPGAGSFFFLAEVFWDVAVKAAALPIVDGSCGACVRCRTECPTGAIVADRIVDSRLCISYLSIEKRGVLSWKEREALGEWVFGCDVCQEVCPFNHTALKENRSADFFDFEAAEGVGPFLDLLSILQIRNDADFRKRFAGTALLRTKRSGLLRNAACVAANTLCEQALGDLQVACSQDADPVIRAHTLWAIMVLRKRLDLLSCDAWHQILDRAGRDEDPVVRAEVEQIRAAE